jgi:tetratricopeptide (TPR) repeat protein
VKRTERHHLKQNELLAALDDFANWYSRNRRQLAMAGAVLLIVAAVLGGIYFYRADREKEADLQFAQALDSYHGVVREDSIIAAGGSRPTFNSEEERYQAAFEAFEAVSASYPTLLPGRKAQYYAALCQAGLNDFEDAEKRLQAVTSKRRDLLFYVASQTLAYVKSERGDYNGAAELYRTLIDDPKNPLAKDQLLFSMARALERGGKLEEARQNYLRFLDEYPNSQLRGEAQQRNELLEFRLHASPA